MYARLSVAAVVSLIFAAQSASAQLCAGAASFTTGRMQAGGQLLSNDDYSSYGVGLSVGTARGPFGGAPIANNDYDFVNESGLWLGASGGYQLRGGLWGGSSFCSNPQAPDYYSRFADIYASVSSYFNP